MCELTSFREVAHYCCVFSLVWYQNNILDPYVTVRSLFHVSVLEPKFLNFGFRATTTLPYFCCSYAGFLTAVTAEAILISRSNWPCTMIAWPQTVNFSGPLHTSFEPRNLSFVERYVMCGCVMCSAKLVSELVSLSSKLVDKKGGKNQGGICFAACFRSIWLEKPVWLGKPIWLEKRKFGKFGKTNLACVVTLSFERFCCAHFRRGQCEAILITLVA